jgi:hypothetical protein
MGRLAASAFAIALASVLVAAPAFAHKLKVFAIVIDGHVDGTVYFVGGAAAAGAVVTVETGDGRPVATVATDGDGRFRFTPKLRADLLIVADSGDGHVARVTIPAEQLGGGLPSSPAAKLRRPMRSKVQRPMRPKVQGPMRKSRRQTRGPSRPWSRWRWRARSSRSANSSTRRRIGCNGATCSAASATSSVSPAWPPG